MAEFRHFNRAVLALERIADVLEDAYNVKKKAFQMVDIDRSKVYKTHLGKSLRTKPDAK